MTCTPAEAVGELERSLVELGDALARRDLDAMLVVEPRVMAALEAVAHVSGATQADAAALGPAILAARTALSRCQTLGDAIAGITRDLLEVTTCPEYSRTGVAAQPASGGALDARL